MIASAGLDGQPDGQLEGGSPPAGRPAGPEHNALGGKAASTAADRAEPKTSAETADRPATPSAKRPADLDDPASLDELAGKVYPRLRRLLRGELLVDRERAGLLGDLS